MQNSHGISYWTDCDQLGRDSIPPPLTTEVKRMARFYLDEIKPVFTVEELLKENLKMYLASLTEKLSRTDVHLNSVTEQAAMDQLKEYLEIRIEKTKTLLELIA